MKFIHSKNRKRRKQHTFYVEAGGRGGSAGDVGGRAGVEGVVSGNEVANVEGALVGLLPQDLDA
ncbi:hypothetical protein NPIL_663851, partial [Nephila pilipes]